MVRTSLNRYPVKKTKEHEQTTSTVSKGTNNRMENTSRPEEAKFYRSVTELIKNARRGLERSVNTAMVVTYYEIGRRIVETEQHGMKRARYGERMLRGLADHLTAELGSGFSIDNLKRMRQFYLVYSDGAIGESVIPLFDPNISWTHFIQLMRIKDKSERRFYEIEIANNGWSLREFQRQYDTSLYERLALSRDKEKIRELAEKGHVIDSPHDLFKDHYVLEFTGLPERSSYTETELEQRLIDHLQQLLPELGKGFSFVKRQSRFTFEEESYFVDLVFYNRLLRCFVLVDLKIGKLRPQDVGQMTMYVNYYDRKVIAPDENPTVGIILCKDKKDAVVEFMLPKDNNQIFAGKYQTVLPNKEELRKALESDDGLR